MGSKTSVISREEDLLLPEVDPGVAHGVSLNHQVASFPTTIEPLIFSSKENQALPIV